MFRDGKLKPATNFHSQYFLVYISDGIIFRKWIPTLCALCVYRLFRAVKKNRYPREIKENKNPICSNVLVCVKFSVITDYLLTYDEAVKIKSEIREQFISLVLRLDGFAHRRQLCVPFRSFLRVLWLVAISLQIWVSCSLSVICGIISNPCTDHGDKHHINYTIFFIQRKKKKTTPTTNVQERKNTKYRSLPLQLSEFFIRFSFSLPITIILFTRAKHTTHITAKHRVGSHRRSCFFLLNFAVWFPLCLSFFFNIVLHYYTKRKYKIFEYAFK